MTDLYLDENTFDLVLSDNDIVIANSKESLRQKIQITLDTFTGEWFANKNFGIPYVELFMQDKASKGLFDAYMINEIRRIEGVEKVLTFNSTFDNRTREWSTIYSVLGENNTVVNGEIN